jgi:hypothetical protein
VVRNRGWSVDEQVPGSGPLRALRCLLAPPIIALIALIGPAAGPAMAAPCDPPVTSEIVCENSKPGSPWSEWDVSGAGDPEIQGFATDISVDQGQMVDFKISSATSLYRLDIYRMGWYGGDGARRVATVRPLTAAPQQPSCLSEEATGLIDCGNWSVSASWAVPPDAVSGIYFAKLVREDGTDGAGHVLFIVRDDDGRSDLLFQTADTTWQAYNSYGGNSLYTGSPAGRAYKVSYNRPFNTRVTGTPSWVFNAEYPMVRWLERNGYDVSYSTGVDTHRRGSEVLEHEAFLSVGHDEYWSHSQRANVEAARAAGVNLAFFSANEVFWKTRWEPSIGASPTANRTLVSYKETHANDKIDPEPGVWTGTWRDPRFSPPADGGRPENALTGQLFTVNDGGATTTAIRVPAADGKMRFWRDTSIATLAAGETATLPHGTLGYEWDEDIDNGHRPPGSFRLSTTEHSGVPVVQDHGSTYQLGTATHHMTLYRHASGALVFGSGTVQWAWGLDEDHDRTGGAADSRMQQATANLFADMGVQPATLQSGLVQPTVSTDFTNPTSTITSPAAGETLEAGRKITIAGTAADGGGGTVGGVEVSVDGGTTWHPTSGRGNWTYEWSPSATGSFTLKSRAADDSGNLETPSGGVTGTVVPRPCPCTIWHDSRVPAYETQPEDPGPIELGVKFQPLVDGTITGLRFYKGATNSGTHVGHLWSRSGTMLAEATFTGETARGWQQVTLSNPVEVLAGTTYVASYHAPLGHYAWERPFFAAGVDSGPLRALADGEDGANGVYAYGPSRTFPTNSYQSTNYWVDVVFQPSPPDTTPPTVTDTTPANGAEDVGHRANVTAGFSESIDPASVNGNTVQLRDPDGDQISATVSYDATTKKAILDPAAALVGSTIYSATVRGGPSGVKDRAGNALPADHSWTFTTAGGSGCPCTIWDDSTIPAHETQPFDTSPVELGVKFRPQVDGTITGLRFYKGTTNTGTHVGHLWSRTGTMLAEATFTGETARGWQQVTLSSPVEVSANMTYVASYHAPAGNYAWERPYFAMGFDSGPLLALADGQDGANGVYAYGPSRTFPTNTYQSTNYWVDVVFQPSPPDTTPPTVTDTTPADGAEDVGHRANATASFSERMDPATIDTTTLELRDPAGNRTTATVSYDVDTKKAMLDPAAPLVGSTTYTATLRGGPSGVKDPAGNALAADRSWSFTTAGGSGCPCTIWDDTTIPAHETQPSDTSPIELGVKFRPEVDGTITGLRFFKGTTNTGTHVGHLWSRTGTMLAEATFTGETARGWQQVTLSSPVEVLAGTTYVASYHAPLGHYAWERPYFAVGFDSGPLLALADGQDGANGIYANGPSGTFPTNSYESTNYWVDVVFQPSPPDTTPPTVTDTTPASAAEDVGHRANVTASFSESIDPASVNGQAVQLRDPDGDQISATVSYDAITKKAILDPAAALAGGTTYSATVKGGPSGVKDRAGNALAADHNWTFTTAPGYGCPCTIWDDLTIPAHETQPDDPGPIELGVKFRPQVDGTITGLRFYKGTTNTGTHVGHLWSRDGAMLAEATFTGETARGWQQVTLANPVDVLAGTTYVASYHAPLGHYAWDHPYFATGFDSGPLRALADGEDGANGVYAYGPSRTFPTNSYQSTNYWVDVVFREPDRTPPTISSVTSTATPDGKATITWTTDEPSDSRVDYGTDPADLNQSTTDAGRVTGHSVQLAGLTPGTTYRYRVSSTDAFGNGSTSPTPPALPAIVRVPVAVVPITTTVQAGALVGGDAFALAADDNVFLQVSSTTAGTRTTDWYGSFVGIPNAVSNLRVDYTGRNTVSCSQTVAFWRWTTNTWVQVSSRSVGTTEIALVNLKPAGAAANYVSGTSGDGDVRVRIRCTRATDFVANGEFLRIVYERL